MFSGLQGDLREPSQQLKRIDLGEGAGLNIDLTPVTRKYLSKVLFT